MMALGGLHHLGLERGYWSSNQALSLTVKPSEVLILPQTSIFLTCQRGDL